MNDSNPEVPQPEHVNQTLPGLFRSCPPSKMATIILAFRGDFPTAGQTMAILPQALGMLQHFRGEKTISEIGDALKAPVEKVPELAVALIVSGCLRGPRPKHWKMPNWKQLREAAIFPTINTGLGHLKLPGAAIRGWFAETEDPELTGVPVVVLALSLSYSQPGECCGQVLAPCPQRICPDRVVVLGPAHASIGKGELPVHNWASRPPSGFVLWTKSCSNCSKKNLAICTTTNWITLLNTYLESQLPIQEQHGNIPVTAAICSTDCWLKIPKTVWDLKNSSPPWVKLSPNWGKPRWWSPRIWPTPARSLANSEPSTKTDALTSNNAIVNSWADSWMEKRVHLSKPSNGTRMPFVGLASTPCLRLCNSPK